MFSEIIKFKKRKGLKDVMATSLYADLASLRAGNPLPPDYFPRDVLEDDSQLAQLGDLDELDPSPSGMRNVSAVRIIFQEHKHLREHRENLALQAIAKRGVLTEKPYPTLRDIQTNPFE